MNHGFPSICLCASSSPFASVELRGSSSPIIPNPGRPLSIVVLRKMLGSPRPSARTYCSRDCCHFGIDAEDEHPPDINSATPATATPQIVLITDLLVGSASADRLCLWIPGE